MVNVGSRTFQKVNKRKVRNICIARGIFFVHGLQVPGGHPQLNLNGPEVDTGETTKVTVQSSGHLDTLLYCTHAA